MSEANDGDGLLNPRLIKPDTTEDEEENFYVTQGGIRKPSTPVIGSRHTSLTTEDVNLLADVENPEYQRFFMYLITAFTAVGGFLFGYDTGVISGAMLYIKNDYSLSESQQELVVSMALVGAAIGALSAGVIADKFGRRIAICFACVLFILGSTLLGAAQGYAWLLAGRVIVGLGIGVASNTVPVYVAEVAPTETRGALVTVNVLFITGGQAISYLVDAAFAHVHEGWRYMLGLAGIPAAIQLIGMIFFVTESPRWLYSRGRISDARDVLRRIRKNSSESEKEIDQIKEALREESGGWRELLSPSLRPALLVGMGLQAFQQFVGINTAMYYSATILQSAGIGNGSNEDAIWYSCGVAAMNAAGTIVSLFLIDRVGRKPLLLVTLIPTAIGLIALGFSFLPSIEASLKGPLALASLLLYIAGFSVGMGPVPWAINSEIYPLRIRAVCSSAATTVNWVSNLIVSITFLSYGRAVTQAGAFWTYASVCGICFAFVVFFMPETKGKSMEEIQAFFKSKTGYGTMNEGYRVQTDEKVASDDGDEQ